MEFSSQTGEEDSFDVGTSFGQLLKEFDTRITMTESNSRVPRRGESIAFELFGILIGQSLSHGDPGYHIFKDWVYEVINGKDDLLPFLAKSSIPLPAGSSEAVEFLNKLDEVETQD